MHEIKVVNYNGSTYPVLEIIPSMSGDECCYFALVHIFDADDDPLKEGRRGKINIDSCPIKVVELTEELHERLFIACAFVYEPKTAYATYRRIMGSPSHKNPNGAFDSNASLG